MKVRENIGVMCLIVLLAAGCGGNKSKPTGAVSGKVTFKGEPVTEGVVSFAPVGEGYFANATISPNGTYQVITQDGGLPLGDYLVSVLPPTVKLPDTADSPGGEAPKQVNNIPAKYRSTKTSGLTIHVEKGAKEFNIEMTE